MPFIVHWLDASGETHGEVKYPLKNNLSVTRTIGFKVLEDNDCVVVITEECEADEEVDFTAIPKSWVIRIEKI